MTTKGKKKSMRGKGLTASKAYVDSWVTPVRVHIIEIFDIDERRFEQFVHEHNLSRARQANSMLTNSVRIPNSGNSEPNEIYFLNMHNRSHRTALQLPYRILLQTTTQKVLAICFAKKETFDQMAGEIIEQTLADPEHPVYDEYDIEQHPVPQQEPEPQRQLTARED